MKRTTLLVLLLLLLGNFWSETYAQKVAYSEDFKFVGLPDGWTQTGSVWTCRDDAAVFNTLLFGAIDTLVSPVIDMSALDERAVLSFGMTQAVTNNQVDWLFVLCREDNGPWQVLSRYESAKGGISYDYALPMPDNVAGGNVQIAFAAFNNSAGGILLDYVKVNNASVCGTPVQNLVVEAEYLTAYGAVISWAPVTTMAFKGCNIKVSSVEMTDMTVMADIDNQTGYTDNEYILGKLGDELEGPEIQPNTSYWFYIQTDCGDGDVSEWTSVKFETPCTPVTAVEEGFEDNRIPDCWKTFNINSSDAAYTTAANLVKTAGTLKHNGNYALFFNNTTTNRSSYVFTPEIEDLSTKQISFWAASAATTTTPARVINVALAPTQSYTSIEKSTVKTFILPEYNGQWYELTVSFKGYTGDSKYVVIYTDNALAPNAIYVDDVVVSPASDCPKPFFPGTGIITSNTAEITWVPGGTETAWNLILSTAPITDFTGVTAATDGVVFYGEVTSNPYTVTGLEPSTNYWYYIQNVCAGTDWAPCTTPLKTTKAMTLPYVEHFDQLQGVDYATANVTNKYQPQDEYVMGCRSTSDYSIFCTTKGTHLGKGVTSSTTVSPYVIANTYNNEESPYYKASLCMTSTTTARSFFMLPAVPGYEVKELMLTFYVCSTVKDKTIEVGVSEEFSNNIAQGQMLAQGGKYQKVGEFTTSSASSSAANAKWEKVEIPLGSYQGKGRFITIMGKAESSVIYIDDITVSETPACYKVANIEGTPVSPAEIHFSWIEQGKSTAWDVNCSSVPLDDPNVVGDLMGGSIGVTSATEYQCTNLQPGTEVYCYVRPHDCDVEWQLGVATSKHTIATLPWINCFSTDTYKTAEAFSANATGIAAPYDMVVGTLSDYRTPSYVTPYITNTAWTNAPDTVAKNSLVFKVMAAGNTGAYAILPEYTGNEPVNDLVLGFYGYYLASVKILYSGATSCTTGSLKIGVAQTDHLTSLDDITYVATVECAAPSTPEYFTVPLASYTGKGKFIVFYTDTIIPNNFAVDNLKLSSSNDPQRVSDLAVSGITTTTADLAWKENGKAESWNVRYYEGRVSDPATDAGTTLFVTGGDAKFTLTQLKTGTSYTVFVQSVSGERTGDWSAAVEFYTECAAYEIGDGTWTEDFNSYDANKSGATLDWTGSPCYGVKGNMYSEKEYHPFVYPSGATYAWITDHTGNNGNVLSLTAATTNTYNALILPEFTDPVNTLQLRFYGIASAAFLASSGVYGWAMIGVWDEETDTFDEVYEFKCEKAQTWQECTVAFDTYKGKGKRIAIVGDYAVFQQRGYRGTGKTSTVYLDDLTVSRIPTCRRVTVIAANAVDSVSAKISWRKAASETSWNVKVNANTLLNNPAYDEATMTFTDVDVSNLTLTGLEAGTVYYVYVQAKDADNDCVSEWSLPLQFQTLWNAFPLPFTLPLTEAMKNKTPDACITHSEDISTSAGISVQTTYAKVNGVNTPVVQMGSSVVGKDNYLILPLVQIDDVRNLQLTMNVTSHNATNITYYEVGVTTDPFYISTYVPVVRDSIDGRTYKASATQSSVWETKIYNFRNYKEDNFGNQGKYITIRLLDSKSTSNGNTMTSRLSFYNITISKYSTCIQPMNLVVDNVDADSVNLSWTDQVKNATFEVSLFTQRPVASVVAEGITDDDINRVPYVQRIYVTDTLKACFKDLLPNTPYYAAVRMSCEDDETSSYTNVVSFRTRALVPQSLPYTETFENIQSTEAGTSTVYKLFPENWEMIVGTTGTDYSGVVNGNQYEGQAACVVYKNNMLVTPQLDIESMDGLFLYCYAAEYTQNYKTEGHNVEIYAVADEYASESDATLIQVVHLPFVGNTAPNGTMLYNPLYVDLSTYKGSYKRIGLKMVDVHMRIDLLTIGDSRATWRIQNLEALEVADTWARVKFIELNATQTSWKAEFGPVGFKHGEGTEVVLTSTTDTVKGLQPNTAYDVYVRSNVDGAEWSDALRIYTTTPVITIPPYEDYFENADTEWQFKQYAGYTNYLWMYRTIHVAEPATYQVSLDLEAAPTGCSLSAGIVPVSYTIYDYRWLNSPVGSKAHNLSLGTIGNSQEHKEQGCVSLANAMTKDTTLTVKATFTKPGLYRLMVLYQASASTTIPITKPAPLKSLVFDEYLCLAPQNVKLTELSDIAATFAWQGGKDNSYEVIVANSSLSNPYLLPENAPERYDYAILEPLTTTYTAKNNLQPNTKYSFYIRSICEAGTVTDFVEVPFETTCAKAQLPLREEFDVEPECWIYDPTNANSYALYYEWNHQVSFATDGISYNVMNLKKGGLIVAPVVDEELNTLRVRFSVGYGNYGSTSSSIATFTVGAMANTFDESTFEEIATYSVPCKTAGSGVVGHLFVEANLRLNHYGGEGKVLAFKAGNAPVFIDWVEISSLPEFLEPQNVSVNDVTRTEALVNWISGEETSWKIRLNGGQEFEADRCPYTLTGLTPGQDYTVEVAAVYPNGVSAYTEPVVFATLCATQSTPFTEDFSQLALNKQLVDLRCWSVKSSEGTIDEVAAGTAPLATTPYSQYYYSWRAPSNANDGLYVYSYENYCANRWLIAPEIIIPENGVLTFDACAQSTNAGNVLKGVFAVAVSTDDGNTWSKETVIENKAFSTNQWKTMHIGLSHYAGQAVRLAFYHGVSVQNNVNLRLDNVHVNCVDTLHAKDTACTGYPYENGPFVYTAESITGMEGQTVNLQKFVPMEDGCDKSLNLQLYVDTIRLDTVQAFVCDDSRFIYEGQEYGIGTYRIPFQTEQGCDGWRYLFVEKDPACLGTALSNVNADGLEFYPNPVQSGTSCVLKRTFTEEEKEGLVLRIYDATGRLVQTNSPALYPIVLQVPNEAGIYMVRLMTGKGVVSSEKLIVK